MVKWYDHSVMYGDIKIWFEIYQQEMKPLVRCTTKIMPMCLKASLYDS
jgi:hypothetical protein